MYDLLLPEDELNAVIADALSVDNILLYAGNLTEFTTDELTPIYSADYLKCPFGQ